MEQKKVTYNGVDTDDVTEQLEKGNEKMAAKGGWTCSAPPPSG